LASDQEAYLAPSDIAKRWGCSAEHVRHLIYRGELPGARFGGILRVRQSDLEAYERAASVSPPARAAAPEPLEPQIAPKATAPAADWEVLKQSLKRSLRGTAKFWGEPRPPRAVNKTRPGRDPAIARIPKILAVARNPLLAEWDARARKGIALLRRPEIAAAVVQWPVIYPRRLTKEEHAQIGCACLSLGGLSFRRLAIRRGVGGRKPDDPELLAALDRLRLAIEDGERKLNGC
jgi:excisionase family DNA binding protein